MGIGTGTPCSTCGVSDLLTSSAPVREYIPCNIGALMPKSLSIQTYICGYACTDKKYDCIAPSGQPIFCDGQRANTPVWFPVSGTLLLRTAEATVKSGCSASYMSDCIVGAAYHQSATQVNWKPTLQQSQYNFGIKCCPVRVDCVFSAFVSASTTGGNYRWLVQLVNTWQCHFAPGPSGTNVDHATKPTDFSPWPCNDITSAPCNGAANGTAPSCSQFGICTMISPSPFQMSPSFPGLIFKPCAGAAPFNASSCDGGVPNAGVSPNAYLF